MDIHVPETLTVLCFIVLVITLVSASIQDLRSREASDIHWIVIGIVGIAAMAIAAFDNITMERTMICVGSALILFDILYDRKWPLRYDAIFYALLAVLFIVPLLASFDDIFVKESIVIPVSYILFVAMYFSGVLKGGADAKCLISIALLFPIYPIMFGYPLISAPGLPLTAVFSFPLAVLFYASVFVLLAMVPMIVMNIVRGDTKMPKMFFGYRMDAARVAEAHVWPVDKEASDDGKMWVTPKIPFIVPITAAVIFVALIGNLFFLL